MTTTTPICPICGKDAKHRGRKWCQTCGNKDCYVALRNAIKRKENSRGRFINSDGSIPSCVICSGVVPKCADRNCWKRTCSKECAHALWLQTMAEVGPDGLTRQERRTKKAEETKLASDPNYYKNHAQKMLTSMGAEGIRKRAEAQSITKQKQFPLDRKVALGKYRRRVMYLSRRNDLSDLPYFINWGHSGGYHLDHIVSVLDGFKSQTLPEIIAHKANLRFIPGHENCSKCGKSLMSIQELQELIRAIP